MIKLKPDTERQLAASIQRYFTERLDEEIGPSIYNQAIRDAQAVLHGQLDDLGGTCYEPEFGYWKK